jgi:hypothetical protein
MLLSLPGANILKDLCLVAANSMLSLWHVNVKTGVGRSADAQRSHECERGTQECVGHNG